jgi:hypothetical protein
MAELPFGWVPWHTRGRYAATGDSELVFGLALQHQFGRLAYVDERSGVPGLHPWFDSPAAARGWLTSHRSCWAFRRGVLGPRALIHDPRFRALTEKRMALLTRRGGCRSSQPGRCRTGSWRSVSARHPG